MLPAQGQSTTIIIFFLFSSHLVFKNLSFLSTIRVRLIMAMSRTTASALLRTRIAAGRPVTGFPPASAASVAPLLRNHQQVRLQHDGDLGGPGGQEPPPQRPAGADTIKRNW